MILRRMTYGLVLGLFLAVSPARAAVTDYVVNVCDTVTYYAAETGSYAEQYGSVSALKQQVKIGEMGDTGFAQKAARKAAKAAEKAQKMQKKAEKAQKMAEKAKAAKEKAAKLKKRAENLKAKADKYAAKAADLKKKATDAVDKAKDAYSDAKEKIDEGKELYNDAKDKYDETKEMIDEAEVMAASLPAAAGGMVDQVADKANSSVSKVSGEERRPFGTSGSAETAPVSVEDMAARVDALPEITPLPDTEPEITTADKAAAMSMIATETTVGVTPVNLDTLPSAAPTAELSANQIMNSAAGMQAASDSDVPVAKTDKTFEEQLTEDNLPAQGETAEELEARLKAKDEARLADYRVPDPNAEAKSNAKMQEKDAAKDAERMQNRRRTFGSQTGGSNE